MRNPSILSIHDTIQLIRKIRSVVPALAFVEVQGDVVSGEFDGTGNRVVVSIPMTRFYISAFPPFADEILVGERERERRTVPTLSTSDGKE